MEKLTAASPEAQSADLVAANIEQLKALFPKLITEGANGVAVNVDVLKALVGDATVTDADEKYGLNWHGKRRARQLALTPSTGTLRPCPEDSVDWDTTQNLMIEGDNLEVLKLLQKSYAGKVKLIYIDPPYNTGKDFVYPDNFQDNIKNYLELTGQIEGGQKISSNTETSGRFHTDWLNMMYPRLKLARNLLRDDGAIFITIDDNEGFHVRQMLDEIFGQENFVANVVWNHTKQSKNDERYFSRHHNQVLVVRKSERLENFRFDRTEENNRNYSNPDNDPRGEWRAGDVRSPNYRETLRFPIVTPSGKEIPPPDNGWRWSEASIKEKIASGEIVFADDEARIIRKIYLADQEGRTPENLWLAEFAGTTRQANGELKELFGDVPFDTPKPVSLGEKTLTLATDTLAQDLVLDFFAGSGTTGHAVMAQNAADGGNRRYVLVQLPEPLDADDKDQKVAAEFCDRLGKPRTIAELTKERLRRAGVKVKADNPDWQGDTGFRVFKLDTSNIRAWNPKPDDLEATLLDHQDHLLEGRSEADVLYELLLKLGLDLCVPIEKRSIEWLDVHAVGGGVLLACLAEKITHEQVEPLAQGIIAWHKELAPAGPAGKESTCVFRDSAFADDVAKTNMAAILQQHGIANVRSL
ncbi:site-specific DNA-methyltransferase [Alcaligenes sp. WGS1538]|uniref:site-specific DNA-methyltransferase n=1 Tax=Alcaligenes sp. WGS1538 TaxID=3366811 RepID=UPI00372D777A